MAQVVLEGVKKSYGDVSVIHGVDLTINDKEFLVFVGPSGCGKSTLLRMIAGLESITDGKIFIDQKLVNDLPPRDRDISMVFQNYALYPHMSVYDNMAFGLKVRKVPRKDIVIAVTEAAKILDIESYLERKPSQLSGGQRQRVAIGRAIVRNPKVFLFDEPLSNLDAKLRSQMRNEIQKLHHRLQSTAIYVTHDQVEAMTMGDRIAVISEGKIAQLGTPEELYNKPNSQFVAAFIGTPPMNFISGQLIEEYHSLAIRNQHISIRLPEELKQTLKEFSSVLKDSMLTIGVRCEDISIQLIKDETANQHAIMAEVDIVEPLGHETLVTVRIGGQNLVVRVASGTSIRVKDRVSLTFHKEKIHFFNPQTELRLF